MFTELPLSTLTIEALRQIRASIVNGYRFGNVRRNEPIQRCLADIDAEISRQQFRSAAGLAS
jgi:hypothetical protein